MKSALGLHGISTRALLLNQDQHVDIALEQQYAALQQELHDLQQELEHFHPTSRTHHRQILNPK